MQKKEQIVDSLAKGIEGLFKKNKVDILRGYGKFQDPKTIQVEREPGNVKKYRSKHFIIATGSEPVNFPGGILPIDEKRVLSSTGALFLKEVPKNLLIVGAGVTGLELGTVYNRLGSSVEVVEYLDRVLPNFDREIGSYYLKILRKNGIKFNFTHKVIGGETNGKSVKIIAEDSEVNLF